VSPLGHALLDGQQTVEHPAAQRALRDRLERESVAEPRELLGVVDGQLHLATCRVQAGMEAAERTRKITSKGCEHLLSICWSELWSRSFSGRT
jgi:hypothetical protein